MTATPPPAPAGTRRRSALGWIAIACGVLLVAVVLAMIASITQLPARGLLDPDAAGPDGSRALARILEREGVEVVLVRDRDAARAALSGGDVTLAWGDTSSLSDETVLDLSSLADDVVLLDPRSRDVRVLLGGATTGGYGNAPVAAACAHPVAERAGTIDPGVLFEPPTSGDEGASMIACYPGDDGFGMLATASDSPSTTAVDATVLLTNDRLDENGNAALGLGLLGRHPRVVWYLPDLFDSDFADTSPELGDLTPPWVTPAIVLLILATVAAAVWRGRRFGPLVAERLPVTVRVGETTEGRARLYARAGDPLHAADQLRIGVLRRAARRLGLGSSASVDEISDAVAAFLGEDRAALRALLVDAPVSTDADLVELAERLHAIEQRLTSRT